MRSARQKLSFLKPSPFELYLPERAGRFPLIAITPILGRLLFFDDLLLERHFARFLAGQGFASALIERPFFEFKPAQGLEQIQDYLEEGVARAGAILDFLLGRDDIDPERLGSLGISFGAVINSLWASAEPRLKAHVFALGGGNLPEMLVSSRDPLMRGYINDISKGTGIERKNLKPALEKSLRVDPLGRAASISPEGVLMILGLFDRVIRFRYGLALWRALGKPRTLFLPLGHYTTILVIPLLKRLVLAFFREKFVSGSRSLAS